MTNYIQVDDLKPNSNKFKEEQKAKEEPKKKVDKVVTGEVIRKKKSSFRKFTDEFISEDIRDIKTYVFGEVLIPAIKKAITDIVTNGVEMLLYGKTSTGRRRNPADRVSYNKYSSQPSYRAPAPRYYSYSYDDIELQTRGEAEDVLERMDELIDTYGLVSVADYYDLVGITGDYTNNNYGWTSLRNASIVRTRGGYTINLPRPIPIDTIR